MSTIRGCIYGALLVFINSNAVAGDFSGVLKSQTSFSVATDKLQQQEWLLDLEYNEEVFGGDLTIIGRARLDTVDDLNYSSIPDSYSSVGGPLAGGSDGIIDLREFYWDVASDNTFLRLGKQQVVWGEADGLKLLDVINPQSFREFILDDFDDSRTPLWMVNIEHSLSSGGVLQLLWIPDTTAHELAPSHSPFAFTSTSLVPQTSASSLTEVIVEEAKAPSVTLENSDIGLRFVQFVGGWDISVNYLYHYVDTPVARTNVSGESVVVTQAYERSHLIGGTASNAFGDWILRTEVAFETDRYHRTVSALPGVSKADQWSTVIGLDWQGWTDQFISMQWFQTTITGSDSDLINNRREDMVTFLWESKFFNETLTLEWLQIHSLDHGDGAVQPRLTYNYETNVDVYLAVDSFYGNRDRLFGQFKEADRVSIGFEWGF
jgi:hypothetical protein